MSGVNVTIAVSKHHLLTTRTTTVFKVARLSPLGVDGSLKTNIPGRPYLHPPTTRQRGVCSSDVLVTNRGGKVEIVN
jgi:hypothetical protein